MSPAGGVGSIWWPTPVRPSRWFSDEELARSRAYHRPLARVGALRFLARLLLLGCVHGLAARLGWSTTGPASVAAVALAWWIPGASSDWWFEFRHEPRFDSPAMPLHRFLAGSLTVLGIGVAGVGLVAGGLGLAWVVSARWWWLLAAAAVPAVVYVFGRLEPRFTAAAHRTKRLEGTMFDPLVEQAGVSPVEFHQMTSDALVGFTALTATGGGRPRIIVSSDLLEADQTLTRHVIAHELSHLRYRHSARTTILTSLAGMAVVAGAGALASSSGFDRIAELTRSGLIDADRLPSLASLAMLALVLSAVAQIPLAFVSRAQERQADAGAFSLVGPVPVPLLRRLHATDRALLDPGLLERIALPHPPPAERLQRGSSVPTSGLPSGP